MENDYIVCVCGDASRAAYLIKGEKNVLFDAGMAYSADRMIENIKRELGDKPLTLFCCPIPTMTISPVSRFSERNGRILWSMEVLTQRRSWKNRQQKRRCVSSPTRQRRGPDF